MKKVLAELIGTYLLVFLGTSAIVSNLVLDRGAPIVPSVIAIAFAFGLALVAIIYAFGPISGAHVNPAVTLGMVVAKKMEAGEALRYWIAQFGGGVLAALTLQAAYGDMAERVNYGANAPGGKFGVQGALLFEIASTTLFFLVTYGAAASKRAAAGFAGIPIGLYFVASHLAGIPISGSSLNPAREFGPALLAGGETLGRVWIYFVGPLSGAVLGGFLAGHIHEGKED